MAVYAGSARVDAEFHFVFGTPMKQVPAVFPSRQRETGAIDLHAATSELALTLEEAGPIGTCGEAVSTSNMRSR